MTKIRTYSELITLPTIEERFRYLKLDGIVGEDTFGFDRYLNQKFYSSTEWRRIRDSIILRDQACELGIDGYEIKGSIYIHHMNPIMARDIVTRSEYLSNPEYLICMSLRMHNALHYGDESVLLAGFVERTKNDTCPWKH